VCGILVMQKKIRGSRGKGNEILEEFWGDDKRKLKGNTVKCRVSEDNKAHTRV